MGLLRFFYGGLSHLPATSGAALYPRTLQLASGRIYDFDQCQGRVVLIVNTASRCGFTKQYDGLEALYLEYRDRGFDILGFPSNDFGQQEPGDDQHIAEYCRINHGVTFQLFPKGAVTGSEKQDVFRFLTEQGPPDLRGSVRWNFEKFLIDKTGHLIGRWRSYVRPCSRSIRRAIEAALQER
jgi:glutathione peroxidase-family protein